MTVSTLDWLIVGGGTHGSYVAGVLHRAAPAATIAVMDPQPPLMAWQRRAAACGMNFLRSPGAHHFGRRADALRRFAATRGFDQRHWLGYYRRPSRALFEAHTRQALANTVRIAARAAAVTRSGARWTVATAGGANYRARRVVLALGPNAPLRPPWGADAEHVYDPSFDPGFDPGAAGIAERVLVVGGGITGAQLALQLAELGRTICWVTHTSPRLADFDSDPCYAGRLCLEPFGHAPLATRTRLLAAARLPGTLPPDVHTRITAALAAGNIAWRRGEIRMLDDAGAVLASGARLTADRVILATGFEANPPRRGLLADLISRLGLRSDGAGHLYVDTQLAAAPSLHIIGRPASLQLGPMAGNIRGARLAGQCLAGLIECA